jgi:hypothetical protein
MGVSGQFHTPVALLSVGGGGGDPVPTELGCVGPRAGMDDSGRQKIWCPCRESNPGPSRCAVTAPNLTELERTWNELEVVRWGTILAFGWRDWQKPRNAWPRTVRVPAKSGTEVNTWTTVSGQMLWLENIFRHSQQDYVLKPCNISLVLQKCSQSTVKKKKAHKHLDWRHWLRVTVLLVA